MTGSEHRADRPRWVCIADGADWPCEPARRLLHDAYLATPAVLVVHLARLMAVAAGDLAVPNPAALHRRFVGWALPPLGRCRACGKPQHDLLPGLPPRLLPWHPAHEAVRGDPP